MTHDDLLAWCAEARLSIRPDPGSPADRLARIAYAAGAEAEREQCAKVCEEWGAWNNTAQDIAFAIRARGTNG